MPDVRASTADGVAIGSPKSVERGRRVAVDPVSGGRKVDTEPVAVAPSVANAAPSAARWRTAGMLFALGFAALIAIYLETALDLWDGWGRTGTYAHGYIIFPVSGWLIWRLRDRLRVTVPRVQPLALIPLAGCGLLWLVGHSAGVHAPEQYALVAMVPCLVWAVFGNDVTRRILYPLAFLFFAVPAGDFLMPTLMNHTADFTVAALQISGVPVFREGNYFQIPSGSWSVVEACSGLRYLIASITLGFLFAYLNYRGPWRRAAFIVASILVPVVANWLRAYMIVMLAHLSSNVLATGVDHLVYGWLFFGLVMMLLFWVGSFWRDDDEADLRAPAATHAATTAATSSGSSARAVALMTAAVIAVAAPWPAVGNRLERAADDLHPGSIGIDDIAGWQKTDAPFTTFVPHYQRARSSQNSTFTSGDRKVALFVGYYSGQLSNGLMVTYDNDVVVVSDKVWGDVARSDRKVDGGTLDVVQSTVRSDNGSRSERLLAWRWFWINGRLTTSSYLAKAYNALDKLTGRGDDSAVIVVTTPMSGASDPQAAETLDAFVKAAQPRITARLAAIRAQARQ